MSKLSIFLRRNTVTEATLLPYVHTTRSYNIGNIKDTQRIEARTCPHFDEDLTYLFVGRPAYKRSSDGAEAEYWELPCCFIFDSIPNDRIKRVFPFDSGAHKSGLYPDYIGMMAIQEFEVDTSDSPKRLISAFFGSSQRYFVGKPKDRGEFENEFQLGPLDAELKALNRLAQDGTPSDFDDRRLSIEVQISGSIDLSEYPPSAVILPSIYLREEKVRYRIIDEWKAEPITYDMYGLSQDKYDVIIYAKVEEYYKSRNLL